MSGNISILPSIVTPDGVCRYMGTHPTPPTVELPMWAASNDVLPESEWVEFEYPSTEVGIKDQDSRGACDGHAAASSLEWFRWIEGYPYVALSAWSIYAPLCNGVDRGASIGDALTLLEKRGAAPESLVPYGTIDPRRLTREALDSCPRFRIEVGKMMTDFAQMMTATQLRRVGNFSICVGSGFNNLDADGCPPVARGAGNHAVTFGLGAKKCRSGEWAIRCQNSWTDRWGLKGYFWVRKAHIDNQAYFESYEVIAATEDPSDPHKPPVVP